MVSMSGINWLAVVVGVVVSNVVGFLWYGPLFGNTWLRIIGKKREDIEASPSMYAVTAVASLVTMVVLAMVVAAFGAETFVDGLVAGAVAGGGLTVIANAPNPAGFAILRREFEDGAISPSGLFVAALPPTIVAILAFLLL